MHPVVKAVRSAAKRLRINDGVLVAVSGGPDSVALLAALHLARVTPLAVGHVNHDLRGVEGDADAEFVKQFADRMSLQCLIEKVDVPTASGGRNIEAVAGACVMMR